MDRKIRVIIKQAQAGNEATVNPTDYDPSFPTRLGMAAVINQAIDNVNINTQRTKNINPLQFLTTQKDNASTTLGKAWLENVRKNTKTGTLDFNLLSTWASSLGVDVNIVKINDLNTAIAGLSGDDKNQGIQQSAIPQLQKYVSEGKTSAQVKAVENQIINDPSFTIYIESIQTQQTVKFQSTGGRIIVSQAEMAAEQAPLMPENPSAQTQDMSNPLSGGKFESMEELKSTLIQFGPKPETYNRIFELVGKDNEDSAKSALSKFFQGSPAGLCILYDMLIKAGVASPVDESIIGGLMEAHPEIFPEEETVEASLSKGTINGSYILEADGKTITVKNSWDIPFLAQKLGWDGKGEVADYLKSKVGQITKVAGLFGKNYQKIVSAMNGLFLVPLPDASMKTMQKVASGGVGSTVNMVYDLAGPNDKRFCPKLRNVISTFQCRYNCLDGLAIGDTQILCGEAIYRQAIMDKFSTEFLGKDGKLEGGYLRERFQVDSNTHEHPALLKPGQRAQPINEDAWIVEKRLQELRREEGKKRGYSETPGDPKDLYNFDQHEIVKGPQAPNLFGTSGRTKTAAFNLKSIKTSEKEPIEAFNLKKIKVAGPMTPAKVEAGTVCTNPACKLKGKEGQALCVRCKSKMTVQTMNAALQETGALPKQELQIKAYVANGIYKVTQGDECAYGSSIKEAMNKLARGIAPEEVAPIEQEEDVLTDYIQEGEQEGIPPLNQPQQVLPLNQPQQQVLPQGQNPLNPQVQPPLQQDPNQVPINPQMQQNKEIPIVPEGTEGQEVVQKEQGDPDIDAQALDSFLEAVQERNPEQQKEIEELAENISLGPDENNQI